MLQEMLLGGLLPDVITYNATISACEKGQKPQQALHLLQEMQFRGLLPNVITYNVAISACEQGQSHNRRCICCRTCSSEASCRT